MSQSCERLAVALHWAYVSEIYRLFWWPDVAKYRRALPETAAKSRK